MKTQSPAPGLSVHSIPLGGRIPPPPLLSWYGGWLVLLLLPLVLVLIVQLRWDAGAVPMRAILSYGASMLLAALLLRLHHTNEQLWQLRGAREERIRELQRPAAGSVTLHDLLASQLQSEIEQHVLRQSAAEYRARQLTERGALVAGIVVFILLLAVVRGFSDEYPASSGAMVGVALTSSLALLAGVLLRSARREWEVAGLSGAAVERMRSALAAARLTESAHAHSAALVEQVLTKLYPDSEGSGQALAQGGAKPKGSLAHRRART